jgi:hypothetical protein
MVPPGATKEVLGDASSRGTHPRRNRRDWCRRHHVWGIEFEEPDLHDPAMQSLARRVVEPARLAAARSELGRQLKSRCFPDHTCDEIAQLLGDRNKSTVSRNLRGESLTLDTLLLAVAHSGAALTLPPPRITNHAVFNAAARVLAPLWELLHDPDSVPRLPLSPQQVQLLGDLECRILELTAAVADANRGNSRPANGFVTELHARQTALFGTEPLTPELRGTHPDGIFQHLRSFWCQHHCLWVWVQELLDRSVLFLAPEEGLSAISASTTSK